MNYKVTDIIFTDKKKDGTELISKSGQPFFMLHILIEDGDQFKWVSKFYSTNDKEKKLLDKIIVGSYYSILYKQSGPYFNIIELYSVKEDGSINELIIS